MSELVKPSPKYQSSFLDAVREAQATGSGLDDTLNADMTALESDFKQYLRSIRQYEPGHELPAGFVHSERLWLVDGSTYLGVVSIRHTLNERLRQFGGHIGYEIRPSARRRGNGKLILKLALKRAKELGLAQILITCDVDNLGSRRVIEANGGKLEGEFKLDFYKKPIRRYWIAL